MGIELRLLTPAGVEDVVLPDVSGLNLSPVLCDAGTIEFSYPKYGQNWASIQDLDEFSIAVYVDGVRQGELEGIVKEQDGDDVDEAGVWKYTGYFNNGRLAEAVTYPAGWPTVNAQEPNQKYLSITVGSLVKTLLQQAQARGTLADFTHASFSGTTDSNGQSWTSLVSIEYAPQVDYLTILKNLYDQHLCEFQVVGKDIRLYKPDTFAVDRTTGASPLVFRGGRDLSDSPRKRSTRDLGTVILASGADGLYVERTNADQVASRRRIETSAGQGQVSDQGTLILYADAELSRVSQAKMEKTHGLSFGENATPRPIRDFALGDWVYSDVGKGLERLRVKQWTLALEQDGTLGGSVVLNDLFAEQNERLSRRIEGIVGGSTITGGSAAERDMPEELVDGIAPSAPASLTLSSTAYTDNQGQTFANVAASWTQVTTNSDGTILEDLDGYTVRWRYAVAVGQPVEAWRYVPAVLDTKTSWSPVSPGLQIEAQVSAHDRVGNTSAWIPTPVPASVMAGTDVTPPGVPSTPIVDNYLGLVRIRYDGKTASGAAVAPDLNFVEVHVSTTSGFTPDRTANSTTRIDTLSAAGSSFYEGTYSTTVYAKLVAVDKTGNASAASAQASATPSPVVSLDIFDGAVGTAKLADLAVTTAKINLLAVNSAQIGSLEVGKLVAGTLSAQVILGNRIATAATGTRIELNQVGLQAWNGTTQTISLNGVNNLLVGTLETGLSGTRRIIIGASGDSGRVKFEAPDGTIGELGVFTGNNVNIEALRVGIQDPGNISQFWKKLQINEDGTSLFCIGEHKYIVGGGVGIQGFRVDWSPTRKTSADPFFGDTDVENRLHILEDRNLLKHPKTGYFQIYQWNTATVDQLRLSMSDTSLTYYSGNGQLRWLTDTGGMTYTGQNAEQRLQIAEASSSGLIYRDELGDPRIWIRQQYTSFYGDDGIIDLDMDDLKFKFNPSVPGEYVGQRFEIWRNDQYAQSPRLWFQTNKISSSNGGVYSAQIKLASGAFEFKNGDDTAFYTIKPGEVNAQGNIFSNGVFVGSDMSLKTEIKTATAGALEKVKGTRVTSYRRKGNKDARRETGLIAQEAPSEIVVTHEEGVLAVDLYGMSALTWAAIQELSAEFDKYREEHP